jgi:hypothetical protein
MPADPAQALQFIQTIRSRLEREKENNFLEIKTLTDQLDGISLSESKTASSSATSAISQSFSTQSQEIITTSYTPQDDWFAQREDAIEKFAKDTESILDKLDSELLVPTAKLRNEVVSKSRILNDSIELAREENYVDACETLISHYQIKEAEELNNLNKSLEKKTTEGSFSENLRRENKLMQQLKAAKQANAKLIDQIRETRNLPFVNIFGDNVDTQENIYKVNNAPGDMYFMCPIHPTRIERDLLNQISPVLSTLEIIDDKTPNQSGLIPLGLKEKNGQKEYYFKIKNRNGVNIRPIVKVNMVQTVDQDGKWKTALVLTLTGDKIGHRPNEHSTYCKERGIIPSHTFLKEIATLSPMVSSEQADKGICAADQKCFRVINQNNRQKLNALRLKVKQINNLGIGNS